jgi:hypothetical protein
MTPERLRAALTEELTDTAWLEMAVELVAHQPGAIGKLVPAAGRRCGRTPLSTLDGWTIDDAARVVLLSAVPLRGADLVTELEALYRYGDAAEKRAVLRALPLLEARLLDKRDGEHGGPDERDGLGDAGIGMLRDALRTNDTRLVSAAVGPYAKHLDDAAWRQAVLKCVFMGIPLAAVADLDARADSELAAMLTGLADERAAAGRTMPDDALALLDRLAAQRSATQRPTAERPTAQQPTAERPAGQPTRN